MQDRHKSAVPDKSLKSSGVRVPKYGPEGLTCSEGQVEDLLSKGESTELDGEEGKSPESPVVTKKTFVRKTSSPNTPRPQQK
jgi:hypothetical protein